MSKPWSFQMGRVDLGSGEQVHSEETRSDQPFRILVLGDFGARASRSVAVGPITARKPIVIDRDNFEEVLASLNVEIHIPLSADPAGRVVIGIKEIDDFHPDDLYDTLPLFESLRDLRDRLGNPRSFTAAADEVRGWAELPSAGAVPRKEAPPPSDPALLLEQMLGGDAGPSEISSAPTPNVSDFQAFLRSVVGKYEVAADDPQQAQLEAVVDQAIGGTMRALLHHPAFQEIEAAWRSLFLLVRRLETDETLQICLLDISRAELAVDLMASDDLRTTHLHNLLVKQTVNTPGGKPWAVLAGNFTFGSTVEDAALLQRLALLASHAGAPFVAAGHRRLQVVSDDEAAVWKALRQFPEAKFLALAAPRFLLRLPYGRETSATERFEFEELGDTPGHEEFLWGNPALAIATLLGQAFMTSGWQMQPSQERELTGLPVVVYREDGEKKLKPCAETLLTDRALEKMLDAGLLTFTSIADGDGIRVARWQSFALPPSELAGRWQGE